MNLQNPFQIIAEHNSPAAFKKYLYTLTFAELKKTLCLFVDHELYNHCIAIESVIQEKISYNVTP